MAESVFISSTSRDLQEYRQVAIEVCNRLKMAPIAMEYFVSMGMGATEASIEQLRSADVYVGIIAYRYGFVEPGYDRAVTEIEYDEAGKLGMERLCFLVDPEQPWPPMLIEYDQLKRVDALKDKMNKEVRSLFTTAEDLKTKMLQALVEWRARYNKQEPETAPTIPELGVDTSIAVAGPPPPPNIFVERDEELQHLIDVIDNGKTRDDNIRIVLQGMPGIGKTTFVNAVAHHEELKRRFPDGVLWVSLGEDLDFAYHVGQWAKALHVPAERSLRMNDIVKGLRFALQDKRMLLIIDNVMEAEHARHFMVGGKHCATIITTRSNRIALNLNIPSEYVMQLEQLQTEEAVRLFSEYAPYIVEQYPTESRQLAEQLDGLPLALSVAGRLLEEDANDNFDVRETFANIRKGAIFEGIVVDRYDTDGMTYATLDNVLAQSMKRLSPEDRKYFMYLGVFAPKPATFDIDALKYVWNTDDPRRVIKQLLNRGLIESTPSTGRYVIHALLSDFAKKLLQEA